MSGTAFGRSVPRLYGAPSAAEARAESHARQPQRWKMNDSLAAKNGNCKAVYWVKEKRDKPSQGLSSLSLRSDPTAGAEKRWQVGTVYKGEWKDNKKHGYGTQIWKNGNKYEGEWADGQRCGHGVFWVRERETESKSNDDAGVKSVVSPTKLGGKHGDNDDAQGGKLRRVYAGNWKDDMKDGGGVYFYADGSRYEGAWSRDQRSGIGTIFYANGDEYTGQWAEDRPHGFGTLTKANRDVYEGNWMRGLREGSGIYYYKQQEKIYDGEWVNDQPKCGVYTDAKNFFDDEAEEKKYAAAAGTGAGGSSAANDDDDDDDATAAVLAHAATQGDPSLVSPRVPRNPAGRPIPRLRMADGDGVLAECIERISIERDAARQLSELPLTSLFDQSSLDSLRRVFASFDTDPSKGDGSGRLSMRYLPDLLRELGLPAPTPTELQALATDLRKTGTRAGGNQDPMVGQAPPLKQQKINFEQFVQAVHIREEERNRKERERAEAEDEM